MDEIIFKVLSGYGLAGIVIAALSYAVLQQYRTAAKINESRLAERDIVIKALENNTQATRENAAAIIARNQVTEELGRAIEKQATAFELFMQKADIHSEAFKDRLTEFKMVIDASAEATRTNSATIRDIRDRVLGRNGS